MKKESIFTGKNADEALENALAELKLDRDSVTYEVIEHEKKGILGFGSTPAKVKVIFDDKKSKEEIAMSYVKTILDDMNIDAELNFEKVSSGRYKLSVNGESSGILIGHHGDTLDSLQYLVNLAVNKREDDEEKGEYMNITLDVENYRTKREETLRSLARRMADKVLKYKKSVVLEPMLPYERRIIHSEVQNIEGVSTNSIGSENNRKVVIFLEETGFQKSLERSTSVRGDRHSKKDDRRSDRRDGERRRSSGGPKKSSVTSIFEKIEKKPVAKIDLDSYDESDYSSTAYLREPTKRFSSFAEYESHMASLSGNKEDEGSTENE